MLSWNDLHSSIGNSYDIDSARVALAAWGSAATGLGELQRLGLREKKKFMIMMQLDLLDPELEGQRCHVINSTFSLLLLQLPTIAKMMKRDQRRAGRSHSPSS